MANAVKKVNTVAIADIKNINTITDTNLKKLNTLEFTGVTDAHVFIADNSSDTSILGDITFSLDSTYDVYEFEFVNIHARSNSVYFTFQVNATGDSGYATSPVMSTMFAAFHDDPGEGTFADMYYDTTHDNANTTGDGEDQTRLSVFCNASDAEASLSGKMTLYHPSSGAYVKHFISRISNYKKDPAESDTHVAGYINDTTAIDDIRFRMSSRNLDGLIKMYGIKKS